MFKNMVDSGYFMYMAEAEGKDSLVNTRTARINAAIKDFKSLVRQGKNPNYYIDSVLASHGFSESELTDAECNKIMRAINGR